MKTPNLDEMFTRFDQTFRPLIYIIACAASAAVMFIAWTMYDPTLDLAYIKSDGFVGDCVMALFMVLACVSIIGFLYQHSNTDYTGHGKE